MLELGCGTGQVTERLLAAGARVVAVDALPEMLEGARRRAPDAEYVVGDIFGDLPPGPFNAVVVSFVLHNLSADQRRALLSTADGLLAPGGTVAVLDWHLPAGRRRGAAWRGLLARIEPARTVGEVLDGALPVTLPPSASTSVCAGRSPPVARSCCSRAFHPPDGRQRHRRPADSIAGRSRGPACSGACTPAPRLLR